MIDEEIKCIFDEAYALCDKILGEHRDLLIATAEYLLEHETMDGADFAYFCEHGGQLPLSREDEGDKAHKDGESDPFGSVDFPETPDLSEFFGDKKDKEPPNNYE